MLRHLASGGRRFGLYPMYVHRRANWEIFAVVRGKCGALLTDDSKPRLRERCLWVFPADVAHGWAGQGSQRCQIAVFHFGAVPALLERAVRAQGHIEQPLTATQARRVIEIERDLCKPYERPDEKSPLVFEMALIELSLLALQSVATAPTETKADLAPRKVEATLRWYNEHMAEQPKLEHVAEAVNVSVRHLRRHFLQVHKESPQTAFTKLRLQRAMELLSRSSFKLDAIATQCGFSSAADFCRVFKGYNKVSPDAWRKTKLPTYEEPHSMRK